MRVSIELLFRLLVPFVSLTSSRLQFGGTGLGLAIVHSLLSMMDGGVSVTTEEGVGSTFR